MSEHGSQGQGHCITDTSTLDNCARAPAAAVWDLYYFMLHDFFCTLACFKPQSLFSLPQMT